MTKTASQILDEAADFLEREDRWGKGNFFKANESNPDRGCNMCAHGAIMYCASDDTKLKADSNHNSSTANAYDLASVYAAEGLSDDDYGSASSRNKKSQERSLVKNHGEAAMAHYMAIEVGLSYEYNDDPNTTKQDVINKLREASKSC